MVKQSVLDGMPEDFYSIDLMDAYSQLGLIIGEEVGEDLVNEIFSIIRDVNSSGMTVLLVEQNARKALQIADRAYVLETGSITLSGTGAELASSDAVKKAYLGG